MYLCVGVTEKTGESATGTAAATGESATGTGTRTESASLTGGPTSTGEWPYLVHHFLFNFQYFRILKYV